MTDIDVAGGPQFGSSTHSAILPQFGDSTLTIHQFPLRTVDGWSPRVMQGFRLFSGAGSTGGWNKWDCCLGGWDQG